MTVIMTTTAIEQETDDLEYDASLTGEVNGQKIAVKGSGTIQQKLGLTEGEYELVALPDGFSPLFLTTVLITGYPNACMPLDGLPNPFAGVSYHYERQVRFRDGGHLELSTRCELRGRRLRSHFAITGSVQNKPLAAVEPLMEAWQACGTHDIEGHFKIAWRCADGSITTADAASSYHLPQSTSSLPVMHRGIQIEPKVVGQTLRLSQKSFTFSGVNPASVS